MKDITYEVRAGIRNAVGDHVEYHVKDETIAETAALRNVWSRAVVFAVQYLLDQYVRRCWDVRDE